jgi:hypothetical protein
MPAVLAGDLQGAMLKLHTEAEPPKVERPAAREKPARAAAAAPEKAKKPKKAERAGMPGKKGAADVAPEKEGLISSFLKKILPGSDPARRK